MAKYAAKGAILAVNTVAAPTVFTTIPGVKDFNLPIGTADQIDVTTHDSAGGYKEYVNGLMDSAAISIPTVWDGANATHAALIAALQAGTALGYKITGKETSPKTYSFQGLVTAIDISWPIGGAQEATLTIKPTGAITIA
jgi:predicted secreted protein